MNGKLVYNQEYERCSIWVYKCVDERGFDWKIISWNGAFEHEGWSESKVNAVKHARNKIVEWVKSQKTRKEKNRSRAR